MKKYVQGFLEQEQKLKEIQRFANLGNWELDIKNNELLWSDEIYRIFDCRPQDFKATYEAFLEFIHPDDREKVNLAYSNSLKTKKEYQIEHRIITKNKQLKFVREKCSTTFNEKGEPLSSFGIVIDITEQKQIEIELAESEDRLSRAIAGTGAGLWDWDMMKDTVFFSTQWKSMLGYKDDEVANDFSGWKSLWHPEDVAQIEKALNDYIDKRTTVFEVEHRLLHKDGSWHWILTRGEMENDSTGKPIRWTGTNIDITARKQAEKALRESEAKFRQLVENTKDIIYTLKSDGIFNFVSPSWTRLLGHEVKEVEGHSFTEFVHPDDLAACNSFLQKIIETKERTEGVEYRVCHKNGKWYWHTSSASPVKDMEGAVIGINAIARDITEHKQAECLLQEKTEEIEAQNEQYMQINEELTLTNNELHKAKQSIEETKIRLELAIEAGEHGFWDWNLITNETYFSPSYYTMLGYKDKELPMSLDTFIMLIHADDAKVVMPIVQHSTESGNPYEIEFRLKCKDGSYKWILGKGKSYRHNESGKPNRLVGVHIDIHEIKRVEKELKIAKEKAEENEERFNLAMKAANDGIFDWNLENNEIYYSPGWKKMLGYEEDEIPNDFSVWEKTTNPEDVKKSWELQQKLITKQIDRFVKEFKMKHKAGHWVDILSRAEAIFDEKGKAVRMVGTHTDITERKKAEEQMRFLSAITENMNDSIIVTDTKGKIAYINKGAQKLYGYTLDELAENSPDLFNIDSRADEIQKELFETIARGEIYNGEALNRRKDGSEFICEFTITPLTDEHGKITSYIGIQRDITENRNLEKVVIRQERLSAIGELASGVAHDFNNVLQIIMGGVEMALVSEEPEQVKQYLKSIKHSASDAASRVRQLQRFAQKSPSQKENVTININNLAEDVIKEVKLLLNQYQERGIHIALESDYRANSNIEGNEGELRTCLVNLVKNSAEAMPEGGRITISTGDDNGQVRVRIADTGMGMDRETQKKIFQPFFSTKGFEPGRGLGMAQVYSTIRDHNGDIYIKESEIDKGTIIEFTLPSSKKQINFEEKKKDISGSAKILWVDDEEMIRNIGLHMLKTLGHRADMASSGAEALEYLAKGNEYDLVITDVGMPEMSGWQLAEQIKKEGYPTKIAVLTGWGTEISQEDKKRYNVSYVLGKPVPLKDLKALIGEVLGGKAH